MNKRKPYYSNNVIFELFNQTEDVLKTEVKKSRKMKPKKFLGLEPSCEDLINAESSSTDERSEEFGTDCF